MRLRKNISRPQKLEDEIAYGKNSKDPTKPAFPHLLQLQVVPFDHDLPPAAFPSLPFPTENSGNGDDEAIAEQAGNAQASSDDDYEMSDVESFPTTFHSKIRSIPSLKSPLDPAFEDEMATSDEDNNTMRKEHEDYQPSSARGVNHGLLGPQVEIADGVEWKDLRPAVQLAIVSSLSDRFSMTKVFDMLGLYAQDLGDVRRLAARYNYQRELEDYLISSMQQDQRSGILRTDHTSRSRGAPEAYQEFQTRNYMTKVQAEVDEGLLQATQAEVNLGKRFLAQQGIQPSMVGCWGSSKEHVNPRPEGPPNSTPIQPVQMRSEVDSGYASARLSPNRSTTGQEAKAAIASKPLVNTRNKRGRKQGGTSKTKDHKVDFGRKPASMKTQQPQQTGSPSSHPDRLSPADDASVASSSSRSRRHVRRSSRYDEAIAELKLRGSGGDLDSDYEMSEENNEEANENGPPMPPPRLLITSDKEFRPPMPSPKLLITSDKRIIGVPAPSSTPAVTTQPDHRTAQLNSKRQGILPPIVSQAHSTTPKRVASPLPLQRVVVRPPKTIPKPKQPNTVAQPSEGIGMNKFNQSLLGMAKERNDFTKSLLKASERDMAKATPWVPIQPREVGQSRLPATGGSRRRSETITAPPFSPIIQRSDSFSNQDFLGATAAFQSSPQTLRSGAMDMKADETKTKGSLPATPNLTSSPPPELHQSVGNSRSIVTDTGSPIPFKHQSTAASASVQTTATSSHRNITSDVRPLTRTPKPASSTSDNISRRLDPVTGMVISDHPTRQQNHNSSTSNPLPTNNHPPQAAHPSSSRPQTTKKPNPLQAAGDQVKKAAFDLKTVATEITKAAALAPPATNKQSIAGPAPQSSNGLVLLSNGKQDDGDNSQGSQTTAEDPGGTEMRKKRKYVKSEKQMLKEARRTEGLRREREAREARLVGKGGENGNMNGEEGGGGPDR